MLARYMYMLMTRTALHARCAIVMPSATMRLQNYAGSGIKSAESTPQADMRSVFIRTTVDQYFN